MINIERQGQNKIETKLDKGLGKPLSDIQDEIGMGSEEIVCSSNLQRSMFSSTDQKPLGWHQWFGMVNPMKQLNLHKINIIVYEFFFYFKDINQCVIRIWTHEGIKSTYVCSKAIDRISNLFIDCHRY